MNLTLVGLSHHATPIAVRERAFVPLAQAAELAGNLAGGGEAVCLSTCNRTELYVVGDDAERRSLDALSSVSALPEDELLPVVYRLRDEAAALHLFRVAAGLDSMVPGEGEILGQVRDAYEAGATGPVLDRLFRQALHAGKKVRAETAIAESPASVSSAAAALAQQVFGRLEECRVLLIGAGHVADLAARSLVARGATIAFVANRSAERAAAVAAALGGEGLALEETPARLAEVDVVVSSTGASQRVLGRESVEAALRRRKGRPLFLIDLAVPRDLDPAINDLEGCYLYDIDALESVVAEGLAGRRREAARAEAIVAAEAESFREWQASRDVVPAIASLRAWAEEIRVSELERASGRLGLSESQREAVESVTTQIVNKLLHLPTVRLKEAAAGADGGTYADALRHLFGLGDKKPT
ncbi:MAG TPA: glutamyl-tRNA reductase [Gaiellaceae bacterium]|nr:glutamyl-tRNA reductase [Gaiellaceae bacterium]